MLNRRSVFASTLVLALLSLAEASAPLRRPVSPQRPLIILPLTRGGPKATLDHVAPALRPYVALQLGAMHRAAHRDKLYDACRRCQAANVPVALHIRTWRPVSGPGDYDGKAAPPHVIEDLLTRFDNIVGLIDAEQFAFTKEQRNYFLQTLTIADRHGVYLILDAGWHSGSDWSELGLDADLRAGVLAHRRAFVPMWEMNIPDAMYTEHAQLMGLWLAEWAGCWGANPQTWMWGEAGFGALGESFGYRYARGGGMAAGAKARRRFPFYGQAVLLPALTGACVFWIGGELAPHCWTPAGEPSAWWSETLQPVFQALVEWSLIPSRERLRPRVRLAVVNPRGWPYVADAATAHAGARSLRIELGAGRSPRLSWANDEPIAVEPGRSYTLSAWVRCRRVKRSAYVEATWFDGARWLHRRSPRLSGSCDWREARVTFRASPRVQFFMIRLAAEGTEGTAWFDDVSFAGEDGRERAPNPGFERIRPGGERPVGWRPCSMYGPGDLPACRRGINALWHWAYGAEHAAEFIPNAGEWFPVICLPPGAESAAPSAARWSVESSAAPSSRSPVRPGRAFVFDRGDALFIANSNENEDAAQTFDVTWRDWRIRGVLGVHHYLLLKRSGETVRALVEGRAGRVTRVRFGRKQPFAARWPADAAVQRRLRGGLELECLFDHSRRKLITGRLGP